ncbi:MAG: hypothetical protein IJY25_02310 [Bacilli bacterium]|nr:hypothetical protein [Clostridia bacterium]MBQ9071972.1 hypothetical protein [Bacilli bacterium]
MSKNSMYILGSIETIIGLLIVCCVYIIKQVIPKLGFVAYQGAAAGSYNPGNYNMSFGIVNFIAIIFILIGMLQIVLAIRKK